MGHLVRFAVMLAVTTSAYHGYCQSATTAPESDGVGPRDMQEPTTAAQAQTLPPTAEDYRGAVARVVARQREGMWYWILLVGGAGLAGIVVLSLLTVLVHNLCGRSQTVDMRHKQPTASQASVPQKHKVPAGVHQTAVAGTDRNYCNISSAPVPTSRVADSMLSWGSEFELAGTSLSTSASFS